MSNVISFMPRRGGYIRVPTPIALIICKSVPSGFIDDGQDSIQYTVWASYADGRTVCEFSCDAYQGAWWGAEDLQERLFPGVPIIDQAVGS